MIDYEKNIAFFKKTYYEAVLVCTAIAKIHTSAIETVELWKGKVKDLNDRETKRLEKEGRVVKKEVKKIEAAKEDIKNT